MTQDNNQIEPNSQSLQTTVSGSVFLNGKAQDDFWKWYILPETLKTHKLSCVHKNSGDNAIKVMFLALPKICQHALIVEWFDSVYIHIGIKKTSEFYYQSQISKQNGIGCINVEYLKHNTSRVNCLTTAIVRANIIYNLENDRCLNYTKCCVCGNSYNNPNKDSDTCYDCREPVFR